MTVIYWLETFWLRYNQSFQRVFWLKYRREVDVSNMTRSSVTSSSSLRRPPWGLKRYVEERLRLEISILDSVQNSEVESIIYTFTYNQSLDYPDGYLSKILPRSWKNLSW